MDHLLIDTLKSGLEVTWKCCMPFSHLAAATGKNREIMVSGKFTLALNFFRLAVKLKFNSA